MIRKVCPIVLRTINGEIKFLAFEHPLAGKQLIKGTVEENEADEISARRELKEESGITTDAVFNLVGTTREIAPGQEWVFFDVIVSNAPENWKFWTNDDGGHYFRFFWHDMNNPLDEQWHEIFHSALSFYKRLKPLA